MNFQSEDDKIFVTYIINKMLSKDYTLTKLEAFKCGLVFGLENVSIEWSVPQNLKLVDRILIKGFNYEFLIN